MSNEIVSLLREVISIVYAELPQLLVRRFDVRWKPDGSPVTAADVYLEERISSFLCARIDGLEVIGEESWTYNGIESDETTWRAVLDPIDGTENFCSGLKEWGVSLSIWRGEAHAGSLLMMPELNEVMFTSEISLVPRSRIVGFSSSYHPDIGEGLIGVSEGRIVGCAVYNLFNVIRGSFARFVNPKGARAWDLLAGVTLAREAGCDVIVDGRVYDGQFLRPDQRYRVDIQHRYDLHSRQRLFSE